MDKKKILFIFFVCVSFCACIRDAKIDALHDVTYTNIKYGASDFNTMDVYLPKNRNAATKVVVLIHGGSWISGDKSEFSNIASLFTKKGFAAVCINYRLANDTIHFSQIHADLTSAIQFIKKNADIYQISSEKIGLVGYSAGAHLALMQAYRYNAAKEIKAVSGIAAPSNLCNPLYQNSFITNGIEKYINATYLTNPVAWQQNSPFFNATAGVVPTFLYHGTQDKIVDVNDSKTLHEKLDSLGVSNVFNVLNTTHADMMYLTEDKYYPLINWMDEKME